MPRPLPIKTTDAAWNTLSNWIKAHPECEVRDLLADLMDDLDLAVFEYERADAAADRLGQKWKEAVARNRASTVITT